MMTIRRRRLIELKELSNSPLHLKPHFHFFHHLQMPKKCQSRAMKRIRVP